MSELSMGTSEPKSCFVLFSFEKQVARLALLVQFFQVNLQIIIDWQPHPRDAQ